MRYEYPGYGNCESFCDLALAIRPDGTAFVVCAERPDNPGTSVTNRAAFLATKVCKDNAAIDPRRLVWLERYPAEGRRSDKPPTWSVVTFDCDARTRTLRNPKWRHIDRNEAERLRQDFAVGFLPALT